MDYAAAFLDENRAFAELFLGVDESTPVPTCPGWNVTQLLRHVGRGDRWAAQIVRDRLDQFLDPRAVEGGKPPPDPADAVSWLQGGAQRLVDAVELSGVETPVWTFLGTRPANWWVRRRLHETAVHRADAAIATGSEFTLDADIAADGITEWLERVAIQAGSDAGRYHDDLRGRLPSARNDKAPVLFALAMHGVTPSNRHFDLPQANATVEHPVAQIQPATPLVMEPLQLLPMDVLHTMYEVDQHPSPTPARPR